MQAQSIYRDPKRRAACLAAYEEALAHWPVPYEEIDVPTRFGATHVIVSGDVGAPPLVLLHGQWATATMWLSLVQRLAADSRVYAIDQIDDVGKSMATRIPASREDYAAWLLAVLDGLGLCATDVAGLSYGGFLAVNLALHAPERVRRLLLLAPGLAAFGRPTGRWALHGLPVMFLPTRLAARWLVQGLTVHGYSPGDLEADQLIAGALAVRARVPFRPEVADDEFAALSMPVLFLVGEAEAMYDARQAEENARRLLPDVEALVLDGAGHMLCTDRPDAVAEEMVRFLKRTESAATADSGTGRVRP